MSDDREGARSSPGLDDASELRPTGLPDAKSAARRRTPLPADGDEPSAREPLLPPRDAKSASESTPGDERPTGLRAMTTSARMRLQLVFEEDDSRPRISVPPPEPDPKAPPRVSIAELAFDPNELKLVRSLGRWIALAGLMTLTIGALTGLSYFTGEGKVAHVVVGILASALSFWLIAAGVRFHRAARRNRTVGHHLIQAFALLRSALLLKAVLLFAAMVLCCFTFSLAASLLFLL